MIKSDCDHIRQGSFFLVVISDEEETKMAFFSAGKEFLLRQGGRPLGALALDQKYRGEKITCSICSQMRKDVALVMLFCPRNFSLLTELYCSFLCSHFLHFKLKH